ncbi:MAG TPA: NAD-binding protein, partial [Tepidiformaceae bacterium]|nr:NAD-binding protein [Tepidiformaceae bacterium]
GFHGHAILAGYGRVGKVVHDVLSQQAIDVVIIEADAGRVSDLRAAGVPVLEGSTSNPVLLERAGLAEAKMLIVAIPDAAAARRIVEFARGMNPGIDIVVRTHSQAERRFLALEMSRHSLRRFGMADAPVELLLRKIRTATLEDG